MKKIRCFFTPKKHLIFALYEILVENQRKSTDKIAGFDIFSGSEPGLK